jgi:hypothetical protein
MPSSIKVWLVLRHTVTVTEAREHPFVRLEDLPAPTLTPSQSDCTTSRNMGDGNEQGRLWRVKTVKYLTKINSVAMIYSVEK